MDSLYNIIIPREYIGDGHAFMMIKKYYIPKGLQDLINKYIANHCPCYCSRDSMLRLLIPGDNNFYSIYGYKTIKGQNYCCMTYKRDAFIFYIGLQKKIAHSIFYNKQSKEILRNLRAYSANTNFFVPPNWERSFKKELSPQEWEAYLQRRKKKDSMLKQQIKEIADSLNQVK